MGKLSLDMGEIEVTPRGVKNAYIYKRFYNPMQ